MLDWALKILDISPLRFPSFAGVTAVEHNDYRAGKPVSWEVRLKIIAATRMLITRAWIVEMTMRLEKSAKRELCQKILEELDRLHDLENEARAEVEASLKPSSPEMGMKFGF